MNDQGYILAVDDTTDALVLLTRILTRAGFQVRPADSGELALAAVAAHPPDLILLDVCMEGMDGFEVCRRLQAGEETRPIPIILISAFADTKDWVKGLNLGAVDYITKPFQAEELLTRVKTHLSLGRVKVSLQQQAAALQQANQQLQTEIAGRLRVEEELRQNLHQAERSRRAVLSALEDQRRAEEQMARRTRQQAVIAELGQLALTSAKLPVLMDQAVRRLAQELEVELCKVLELLPDGSGLLLRAGVGWQEGMVGNATVGIGLDSQAGFTLQTHGPVIVEDLREEKRFQGPPLLHDHHVISGLSTVIGDPDRPYGVLGAHTTRRRTFAVHDVHFLQGVANLLASAVQHFASEAEIKRINRLYATLSQVNQTVLRCQSREELFQLLCRVLVEFGKFKAAWVGLKTGGGGSLFAVAHHLAAPDPTLTLPGMTKGCGLAAEAVCTGRPSLSNEAQGDERTACCQGALSQIETRSCAAFPFQFRGEVYGTFGLCSVESGFFNLEEVRLLEEVAQDISYALEHLDREEQRQQAEQARELLLTELKRRTKELESLLEGTTGVLEGEDFSGMARRIFNAARNLTGARSGYVGILKEDGKETEVLFVETGGLPWAVDSSLPMPLRGLREQVIQTGDTVLVNDFMKSQWAALLPPGHVPLQNVVFAPLKIEGKILGIMGFGNKPEGFTEDDRLDVGMFGQLTAIALQKWRSLKALQEREEMYKALVAGLPDTVKRLDREGRHLFMSRNTNRVVDLPPEAFIGKTHRELGFPETLCRFWEESLQEVFTRGEPIEAEVALEGKRGPMFLNQRLVPEFDADGKVRSVLSVSRDISEHRRLEQDYQNLFREMQEGFAVHEIICDEKGRPVDYRFLAVNPAFERMTGLKAENVLGRTVMEVLPGIESYWIETFGNVALTGEPAFFQNYSKELGKHFEVRAFRPAPYQFACSFVDISERKGAEEEKAKLQGQLNQVLKMESIGRLAGGVAHDFNNMLMVILGHTELALNKVVPGDPLAANLKEIRKAAQKSTDLTRQLLAFARKQTIAPRVLNPNETVASILKMLGRLIGEDIDLAWQPGASVWPVKMDPSQVDQILANLCVNARDAIAGVGKITIETSTATFDEAFCARHPGSVPGEYAVLSVSDNGCGMDQAILDRLFEPFFTTKEMGKGTGLGLATVYGIVKQNSGFIEVDSKPGQGSTFRIYLPRHLEEAEPMPPKSPAAPTRPGRETLLVVEDEPGILKMSKMVFEGQGYTVLTAATPAEAIRRAKEHKGALHLLLTDVVMPGMNGRDLAKILMAQNPTLKCLFMSGYTADVIAHRGVLDEGIHFIQKPMPIKELVAKVRQVLDLPGKTS